MSQYIPLPPSSPSKFSTLDEDVVSLPSNLDLALNGGVNTHRHFLSPRPPKGTDASLLDPEAFRRLSISTISSFGRARSVSPYPHHAPTPRTWREAFWDFWHRNQGLLLVTFSQLFGALMNVTTRLLELEGDGMNPFQILFARQGLTTLFCSAWMWWTNVPDFPLGKRGIRGLLVARAVTGFFGIFGMYYSLQYLPVADAVVITFLAPSVASYGCYLFLSEPFSRSDQYASLVSLLGVFLIARPTSLFSSSSTSSPPVSVANNTTSYEFPTPTSAQRLSAVIVALIGVLGAAGAFTSLRWIGSRAHPLVSVNYFSVFCTIIATLALSLGEPLHISSTLHFQLPNGLRQWTMLFFLGACGFVMQYLLTRGLAAGGRAGGARATNMIYTNMLFALALDRIVFGVTPGLWSLAGSGLIFGGAVWVAVGKQRENGKDENAATMRTDEGIAMLGRDVLDENDGDLVEVVESEAVGGVMVENEAEVGVRHSHRR